MMSFEFVAAAYSCCESVEASWEYGRRLPDGGWVAGGGGVW